jgi:hypothetical protein
MKLVYTKIDIFYYQNLFQPMIFSFIFETHQLKNKKIEFYDQNGFFKT